MLFCQVGVCLQKTENGFTRSLWSGHQLFIFGRLVVGCLEIVSRKLLTMTSSQPHTCAEVKLWGRVWPAKIKTGVWKNRFFRKIFSENAQKSQKGLLYAENSEKSLFFGKFHPSPTPHLFIGQLEWSGTPPQPPRPCMVSQCRWSSLQFVIEGKSCPSQINRW